MENYIVAILSIVLTALLGIVSYFLVKFDKNVEKLCDNQEIIKDKLIVYATKFDSLETNCEGKHKGINSQLHNHEKRISDTEKKIIHIETSLA